VSRSAALFAFSPVAPDGVTEALLLANGVSIDVMVEIINAGLAVAHVQQLARPRIEVTVVQITSAGRLAVPSGGEQIETRKPRWS
jgi:Trk K+ transport system NAD-binding subunit